MRFGAGAVAVVVVAAVIVPAGTVSVPAAEVLTEVFAVVVVCFPWLKYTVGVCLAC